MYVTFIIAFFLILAFTFPGYIIDNSLLIFRQWAATTLFRVLIVTAIIWLIMSVVSTGITIVSVCFIFSTVLQLKRTNPNLKFNFS